MLFTSVKETNRLISKGMSNIYLEVAIEKNFSKLRFSKFKKCVSRSIFGQLQLIQISLNFKTSCCSLEIRGLGAKLCVVLFYYFNFERNYDVSKSNSPRILLNKNINFNKIENGKSYIQF